MNAATSREYGPQGRGYRAKHYRTMENSFQIRRITEADMPVILSLIRELAEYERAPDAVVASETGLREVLFGAQRPGIQISPERAR